jgi:hypothetical protein
MHFDALFALVHWLHSMPRCESFRSSQVLKLHGGRVQVAPFARERIVNDSQLTRCWHEKRVGHIDVSVYGHSCGRCGGNMASTSQLKHAANRTCSGVR